MKEFFAINVDTESSESSNAIERALSSRLLSAQEKYTREMQEFEKRANVSPSHSSMKAAACFIALFALAIFFGYLTKIESASEIKPIHWILLTVGICSVVIAMILHFLGKSKVKKVANDERYLNLIKEGERIYDECLKDLNVPKTAKNIDLFLYVYTTKGGEERPVTKLFKYVNTPVKVFTEGDKLMIADLQTVFSLEKKQFKSYEIIEQKTTFNTWNKEESALSSNYKEYKIKISGVGVLSVKNCYKVILEKDGGEFSIVVPPYDAHEFLKLCGIK